MINKPIILKIIIVAIPVAVLFFGMFFYNFLGKQNGSFGSIVSATTSDKNEKLVALTFDDGPYGESTTKILDILKEKGVKATFFVVGKNVQKYPDILKREVAEGHVIGNHSFDHSKFLTLLGTDKLMKNIENAENVIVAVAGVRPRFFRPPYGLESSLMAKDLKNRGYVVILWNDSTKDYYVEENSNEIADRILKELKPGAIIDLHDGRDVKPNYPRENLIEALPIIIDKIREEGYTIVTVDKIIKQDPYF